MQKLNTDLAYSEKENELITNDCQKTAAKTQQKTVQYTKLKIH